jgi:hypothetical protein
MRHFRLFWCAELRYSPRHIEKEVKNMITKRTFSITSAILITAGLSLGQAGMRRHHTETSDARQTLRDIEGLAADVEDQADQLVQFSQKTA